MFDFSFWHILKFFSAADNLHKLQIQDLSVNHREEIVQLEMNHKKSLLQLTVCVFVYLNYFFFKST